MRAPSVEEAVWDVAVPTAAAAALGGLFGGKVWAKKAAILSGAVGVAIVAVRSATNQAPTSIDGARIFGVDLMDIAPGGI